MYLNFNHKRKKYCLKYVQKFIQLSYKLCTTKKRIVYGS